MDNEHVRLGNQIDKLLKENAILESTTDYLLDRNNQLKNERQQILITIKQHIQKYEELKYHSTTHRLKELLEDVYTHIEE